ncbi:MAG: hypothetical protein KF757_03860 [Phycisphaeraceae bacterium]|nr:hypothetical protein [Phycisphaeraceae bacterium]MCW5763139.1 hypothetical protein [Phycisphaeraceae bacterium]
MSTPVPNDNPGTPRAPGEPIKRIPINPRRVRGGVRTRKRPPDAPRHWAAERIIRIMEAGALGEALREGIDYARNGQTRRITIDNGFVEGSIQGRSSKPYLTRLSLTHFTPEERDRLVHAMVDQSGFAAKLLAGELPPNIEDIFAPLGLKLFPTEPDELATICSCREPKPWCKHAVCLAALLAERLGDNPLLMFELRGIASDAFIALLRDRRAITSQGPGPAIVYQPQIPGVSDRSTQRLEANLDHFWDSGPELDLIDAPLSNPEVSHVLLRRLGQSPFTESRFPLVGLLATCYEMISQQTVGNGIEEDQTPNDDPNASGEDADLETLDPDR